MNRNIVVNVVGGAVVAHNVYGNNSEAVIWNVNDLIDLAYGRNVMLSSRQTTSWRSHHTWCRA